MAIKVKKEVKVVEPQVKREFVEAQGQHWYPSPTLPDIFYPSVTTILSVFPKGEGFNKYLANSQSYETSQAILKAAGQRGTNVHKGTEFLEQGATLLRENYTLEEWEMLEDFVNWHHAYNPELEVMEYGVVSDEYKTGGTIDRVYTIDGLRTLFDIKTSTAIHDNYWVQVAEYALMYEDKTTHRIDQTAILRLGSKHKCGYEFLVRDIEEWHKDATLFPVCHTLWNHINPNAAPKIVEVPKLLKL